MVSGAAGESLRPEFDPIAKSKLQVQGGIVESCLVSQRETRMSAPADVGDGAEAGIVQRNCESSRRTAIQQVCQVAPVRKASCAREVLQGAFCLLDWPQLLSCLSAQVAFRRVLGVSFDADMDYWCVSRRLRI